MKSRMEALVFPVSEIIVGKEDAIHLAIARVLARGHLPIEDLPGWEKQPSLTR